MPRVLIADDEDSMRALVARAIAMDGHETVTAEDGAEALDMLVREQGGFDLLLTDIQMPVMDGIALALAAARDFPDLKILLMTGFADQRERAFGLSAIVHDVVTKPFSVADIRTAVADALAAKKADSTPLVVAGLTGNHLQSHPSRRRGIQYARVMTIRCLLEYRVTRIAGDDGEALARPLNNPSAAARCSRARAAGVTDRPDGGAILPGSAVPAARRSRRGSSPNSRR